MADAHTARVDVAALRDIAEHYQQTADALARTATARLAALTFGGACAGRVHTAKGDALREALRGVADDVAGWSRASAEVAAALRSGSRNYEDAERRNVAALR